MNVSPFSSTVFPQSIIATIEAAEAPTTVQSAKEVVRKALVTEDTNIRTDWRASYAAKKEDPPSETCFEEEWIPFGGSPDTELSGDPHTKLCSDGILCNSEAVVKDNLLELCAGGWGVAEEDLKAAAVAGI